MPQLNPMVIASPPGLVEMLLPRKINTQALQSMERYLEIAGLVDQGMLMLMRTD
jgi:hypothetical protein